MTSPPCSPCVVIIARIGAIRWSRGLREGGGEEENRKSRPRPHSGSPAPHSLPASPPHGSITCKERGKQKEMSDRRGGTGRGGDWVTGTGRGGLTAAPQAPPPPPGPEVADAGAHERHDDDRDDRGDDASDGVSWGGGRWGQGSGRGHDPRPGVGGHRVLTLGSAYVIAVVCRAVAATVRVMAAAVSAIATTSCGRKRG